MADAATGPLTSGAQKKRKNGAALAPQGARAAPAFQAESVFEPLERDEESEMRRVAPGALNRPHPEDALDRRLHAAYATITGGVSPWAALQALEDWALHLSFSPARMASLGLAAWTAAMRVGAYALDPGPDRAARAPFRPAPEDRRFRQEAWRRRPFDLLVQNQLAAEAVWDKATEALPGVRAHHMRRTWFMGAQGLRALAPANFALTNPLVHDAAMRSAGASLVDGAMLWWRDAANLAAGRAPISTAHWEVGKAIAATMGRVIARNPLMELIQYAPTTPQVRREPILIVPAWIMKYYILDLSPENSLIKYLVDQGFTVFCISWRNPGKDDQGLTLDDYRIQGVLAALQAVKAVVPEEKVHAVGYCLGGTILAIAAAALARDHDRSLATLTLLAAQTDFSEAGELMMFTDESQIAVLEDVMNAQGYLDARQMSGAFYALRSNDLLWGRIAERYLMGLRQEPSDLDAWFTDPTRMPARMHSQYLRWLFLENRLAQGNLDVDGHAATLKDLNMPIFALGAERDHIAPWRSVYKVALFAGAETTFVLSGGGHNSAVVSPPNKARAHYRRQVVGSCDDYVDPDAWLPEAALKEGSWWPAWVEWLAGRSAIDRVAPPPMGRAAAGYPPMEEAPGTYVFVR